jgi:hypothetical protein
LGWAVLAVVWLAAVVAAPAQTTGPVVSYAGAMNQDGCPDCCQFSCRLTPTPTPHIDPLGRRVFERSAGRFLFVVEGALGESFQPPTTGGTRRGTTLESLGNFTRPGIQIIFNQALGDGSTFVECGTTIQGGVPSAVGLTETQRTAAMRDAACRFEWVPYTDACTRNRFGGFATLSDDTLIQYCFQVAESVEFPAGDTVAGIQLMDRFGNLGPVEEVVIRVGAVTPTPTPTPGGNLAVAGVIAHFSGDRPVGGVVVEASSGASSLTSGSGGYSLSALPPAFVEIVPRKVGDVGAAVSALDAAWVLQANGGLRSLTAMQRLACDVTGDGTLTDLDATEILRRVAGVGQGFPVAGSAMCDSDWAFFPEPAAAANQSMVSPTTGAGGCQPGAIRYDPLATNAADQSFVAVPFGDCTGNWQGAGGAALASAGPGLARLGPARRGRSPRVRIPLYLDAPRPFHAAVIDIAYDARQLMRPRLRRTAELAGARVLVNAIRPGQLRVVVASAAPLAAGEQPIAVLDFRSGREAQRRGHGAEIRAAAIE